MRPVGHVLKFCDILAVCSGRVKLTVCSLGARSRSDTFLPCPRACVCGKYDGTMSTMNEQITEGMKVAMRAKDTVALGALRGLKAALQNARLAKGSVNAELTAAEEQNVVRKQIKQREDSIALYAQAGRTEQVEKEQAEIGVLAALLPQEMTEAEILPLLEAVIAELGATSKKDMGRVMKEMQARTEGLAPGKVLSALVGSRLN